MDYSSFITLILSLIIIINIDLLNKEMSDFIVESNDVDIIISTTTTTTTSTKTKQTNNLLNDKQNEAVDEFLRLQNWPSNDARNWNMAVKFLMARRFDVKRAITLYQLHETLRQKENLHSIDLNDREFINDLESGKFTILPFVRNQPACALFTVRLHSSPTNEHKNLVTLKTLIYQLDGALEHADAQRNGIIFIYDMNNCKKSNYDLALSQKILTLIRGSYPARLNKLLVVQAPFWFQILVKLLSVLLREKLRDRVTFVTNDDVKQYVPLEVLPDYLGGHVKVDHKKWLKECERLVNNKSSTCYYYYNTFGTNDNGCSSLNTNRKRPSSDFIDDVIPNSKKIDIIDEIRNSIHQEDDDGMNINELVEHVKKLGIQGIYHEFTSVKLYPSNKTINSFFNPQNKYKNRYSNVVCLDDSRVKLKAITDEFVLDSDYIHANYVDGYKQKNAYISTQGPLEDTIEDFWLMIWQESVNVIVMTTKVRESKAIKCSQYWPLEQTENFTIANFDIKTLSVEQQPSYTISKIQLVNVNTGESRDIIHAQFTAWPDHGCPKSPSEMIEFVQIVRKHQRLLTEKNTSWNGHHLGPPIVVHCSAGIGRTGTFCTIDIALNRIKDNNRVNIVDILQKIRTQRAQSVQTPEQYLYCYMAILQYALDNQLIDSKTFNLMQLFSK